MAHVIRTELAAAGPAARGECLLALAILSDAQVLDAVSPARCEWVALLAADPRWQPLQPMYRPYDTLVHWALAAHVDALRREPVGRTRQRPFDLALSLGDNIDNAQHNELATFLSIVAGGRAQLSAVGAAQDASAERGSGMWPFWCPDRTVSDPWKSAGYPAIDDFSSRASEALTSAGLGFPWTSVPGNHDVMRQGTALPDPAIEAIAVGSTKMLYRPAQLQPADPLALFVAQPAAFSFGGSRQITPDPLRRAIDRSEWLAAHVAHAAVGFTAGHVRSGCADTVIDTEHVRLILLDTNHPWGDYQGSVGDAQLQWLDDCLAQVDARPARLAILASHHGALSLTNERGDDPQRQQGAALLRVLHRHRSLVAWLTGHRHRHVITPHPGACGGFWEVATASLIDWPSQTRDIECVRMADGSLEIVCTLREHGASVGSLAHLHHAMACLAAPMLGLPMRAGADDSDVRLVLAER